MDSGSSYPSHMPLGGIPCSCLPAGPRAPRYCLPTVLTWPAGRPHPRALQRSAATPSPPLAPRAAPHPRCRPGAAQLAERPLQSCGDTRLLTSLSPRCMCTPTPCQRPPVGSRPSAPPAPLWAQPGGYGPSGLRWAVKTAPVPTTGPEPLQTLFLHLKPCLYHVHSLTHLGDPKTLREGTTGRTQPTPRCLGCYASDGENPSLRTHGGQELEQLAGNVQLCPPAQPVGGWQVWALLAAPTRTLQEGPEPTGHR